MATLVAVRRGVVTCMVLLVMALVAACGYRPGSSTIGYLKDGRLWTINADGSYPAVIPAANVLGFAWSPDHHQIVLRTGTRPALATGEAAGAPDGPSNLSVTSADGGGTVTITSAVAGLTRGDAWWDADGNRLLYGEGVITSDGQSSAPFWVLSQPDQPAGIARIVLQGGGGIPAMAPDGLRVAAIDSAGAVHVGTPGTSGRVVATGALQVLPITNHPARLLWQPGHDAVLYAVASADEHVGLVLTDFQGHSRVIARVSHVLDYAFAPDGTSLLVQTDDTFAVWRLGPTNADAPEFSWHEADGFAQAWWSPDGRWVLVRDTSGLWLADMARRGAEQVLALRATASTAAPEAKTQWRPLAGSPWSADGAQIVFADPGSSTWRGHPLPTAAGEGGLYIVGLSGAARSLPRLLVAGAISAPSWSYLDPAASWLVAP